MDLWVPTTMKNAAKCDMSCELQDQVSHQIFERTLLTPVLVSLGHTWFRLCHHHSPPVPQRTGEGTSGVGDPRSTKQRAAPLNAVWFQHNQSDARTRDVATVVPAQERSRQALLLVHGQTVAGSTFCHHRL